MANVKVKACCKDMQQLWDNRDIEYVHGLYCMDILNRDVRKTPRRLNEIVDINYCMFCGHQLHGFLYESSWRKT